MFCTYFLTFAYKFTHLQPYIYASKARNTFRGQKLSIYHFITIMFSTLETL